MTKQFIAGRSIIEQILKYKIVVIAALCLLAIGSYTLMTDDSVEDKPERKISKREQELLNWARGSKRDSDKDGAANTEGTDNQSDSAPNASKTGSNTGKTPGKAPTGNQSNNSTSAPGTPNTSGNKPNTTAPPNNGKITEPPKDNVDQSKPLPVEGLTWKVRSVSTAEKLSFHNKEDVEIAKGKFLIVQLEVKSTGENEYFIDTEWIEAIGPDKQIYSTNSEVERWLEVFQDKKSLYYAQVAPGRTAVGYVVFDVPKDLKAADLAFYSMDESYEGYSSITIKF